MYPSYKSYTYDYAISGGLPKLSNFIDEDRSYFYENYDTYKLLLTYVYLFILGAGDVGLWNTLIDDNKHKIYVIDYEENRKVKELDDLTCMFYFSKDVAIKYQWFENVGKHYLEIIEDIKVLGKDSES